MTIAADIVNRALQVMGTRTTVSAMELSLNTTNEAIQANLVLTSSRRDLMRMAPWNFSLNTANLTYITSSPGTPENTTAATTLWQRGQPAPPWSYEYQYPVDCLRACWLIPSTQTGFAGGIPITTAVTGGAASFWQGPPVKFRIQNDQFFAVNAAAVQSGGSGYAVGDIITLVAGLSTSPPIGAPVQLQVTSTGGGGAVTGVAVVASILDSSPALGGAYFAQQPNPQAQGSTTGVGLGATFNLTYNPLGPQRVILTNQEFATCTYVQDVTDPDLMDSLFIEAWVNILGAQICFALNGDKGKANELIGRANAQIMAARTYDANEALTVNDVTPDWIRIRGVDFPEPYSGPYTGFDWGGMWPIYG